MASHGCTQPNPYIFEIEKKRKAVLGHELGQGAKCQHCLDKCSGFSLHYWRKICLNCRCPKEDHDIEVEEDPGIMRIGRLFERPLRSMEEELSYCYGTDLVVSDPYDPLRTQKKVKFDWIPPGTSLGVVRKYMEQLPKEKQPIEGSVGALNRRKQLEVQIPSYDMDFSQCQCLSQSDKEGLEQYVKNLKQHAVGQGIIKENEGLPLGEIAYQKLGEAVDHMKISAVPKSNAGGQNTLNLNETKSMKMIQSKPWVGTAAVEDVNLNKKLIVQPLTKSARSNSNFMTEDELVMPTDEDIQNGNEAKVEKNQRDPVNHWECQECKGKISPGEVAVFAERAGEEKCWHPNCFTCAVCKELLVDLIYFYHAGLVYCGRHFSQTLKMPRCKACDELIFSKEYTRAEDADWHIDHFCCWGCDQPLAERKYVSKDGNPICLDCYGDKFGKVCMTCNSRIAAESQRIMWKEYCWHATPHCFKCSHCHKSLLKSPFLMKQDFAFCSTDCRSSFF